MVSYHLENSLVIIILVILDIHIILVILVKALEAHKLFILGVGFFLNHNTILNLTVLINFVSSQSDCLV